MGTENPIKRGSAIRALIIAFICLNTYLFSPAQEIGSPPVNNSTANRYGDMSTVGGNPFQNDDDPDALDPKGDSTKRRIRKPLESYFFDDSTQLMNIFVWNIDTYTNHIRFTRVDTLLDNYRIDYPYFKKGVGDAIQGNLGGATVPLNYFDRPHYRDYTFAEPFDVYFWKPDNTNFYNVKTPYTHLTYFMAGQKRYAEEGFYLTHAQNISPSTGFNIDYKSRGTRGIYTRQKARAKNLSLAFNHTGKKYSVHAGYIYNAVLNRENGGVRDDRDITDTIYELTTNVPINLTRAENRIKNNTFYLMQSYGVPFRKITDDDFSIAENSTIFFGHYMEYTRWHKNYTDVVDDSAREYYANWFIDPVQTRDSISETKFANRLFIQLQPFDREGIIGLIDAGAGVDLHSYYMFRPGDYLSGRLNSEKKTAYYLYGSVDGKFKRYFDWKGYIRFNPVGYRSGDMLVEAEASLRAFARGNPIALTGKFTFDRRSADYWRSEYYSNHFIWQNSGFNKENETRIELALNIPSINFEVGAGQSVIGNKIYYGPDLMPMQASGNVSVTGLYVRKDFRAGGFHFNHRVLLQWSTDQDIIPVPMASGYLAYYFEFNVVRNVLRMQLGLDGRYNTKYYAYGYNPAITALYNQKEKEIGGYPWIDGFVSAKWKRMRILIKMEHLNHDMFRARNYFSLLHYPMNKRMLKIGFSWGFYD